MALQSAVDCRPSTGRPRNFSTCFWYGPAFVVQLAACAGAAPSASVSGATIPVTPSTTAPRLPMFLIVVLLSPVVRSRVRALGHIDSYGARSVVSRFMPKRNSDLRHPAPPAGRRRGQGVRGSLSGGAKGGPEAGVDSCEAAVDGEGGAGDPGRVA